MLYAEGRELPGGDVIVPGGLASVLDTILHLLPEDVIQTGSLVSNIDWSAPEILVTSETGESWLNILTNEWKIAFGLYFAYFRGFLGQILL